MSRPRYWIELLRGRKGAWYHRTKARNGRIFEHSEPYSSMRKAVSAAVKFANEHRMELRYVLPKRRAKKAA